MSNVCDCKCGETSDLGKLSKYTEECQTRLENSIGLEVKNSTKTGKNQSKWQNIMDLSHTSFW